MISSLMNCAPPTEFAGAPQFSRAPRDPSAESGLCATERQPLCWMEDSEHLPACHWIHMLQYPTPCSLSLWLQFYLDNLPSDSMCCRRTHSSCRLNKPLPRQTILRKITRCKNSAYWCPFLPLAIRTKWVSRQMFETMCSLRFSPANCS
jgi:hypothetical protein